jgi:hypothetical protein
MLYKKDSTKIYGSALIEHLKINTIKKIYMLFGKRHARYYGNWAVEI